MRFSADGTKIAAGSHSCVKVFDVGTFRQLYVCRKVRNRGELGERGGKGVREGVFHRVVEGT